MQARDDYLIRASLIVLHYDKDDDDDYDDDDYHDDYDKDDDKSDKNDYQWMPRSSIQPYDLSCNLLSHTVSSLFEQHSHPYQLTDSPEQCFEDDDDQPPENSKKKI